MVAVGIGVGVLRRRRTRAWQALVLLVAVALLVTGARGQALAAGTPTARAASVQADTSGDCVYGPDGYDPPLCDQGLYAMTDEQRGAIGDLWDLARQHVAARYGMDPAVARDQLAAWGADAVRAEMSTMLVDAAARSDRTGDEVVALRWFGETLQKRNVFAAQAALAEYSRFYGENEGTGRVPSNACTYHPPAPFQSEYDNQAWVGCQPGGRPGLFDLGPQIPSQDDFTRWGLAAVAYRTTPAEMVGLSAAATQAAAAAAAAVAAGTAITGLIVLNTLFATSFASSVASGSAGALAFALAPYAYLSGGALAAGTVAGVAATVVIAAALLAMSTIRVVDASQVGGKLHEALDRARTVQPDVPAALRTADGYASLLVDLGRVERRFGTGAAAATPTRSGSDPVVVVADRNGVPGPRTDRFRYLALTGASAVTDTRQLAGGWFVDPSGARPPRTSVIVEPWDPDPPVVDHNTRPRKGFDYPAAVSVVRVGGRPMLSMMTIDRPGYPKKGSDCNDLDADGCWLTDAAPYLDDAPTTPGQQKLLRVVDDLPPGVLTAAPVSAAQEGGSVALQAYGLSDPDGDAVTPVWEVVNCPARVYYQPCPDPADLAQSSLVTDYPGRYTVRLSARDSFGAVTTAGELSVDVADLPPRLTTTSSGGSSVAQGSAWALSLSADHGPFRSNQITVDWGDGTSSPSSTISVDPRVAWFKGVHTWARAGHYDVRATVSDAQQTVTSTVPVDVTPVSPTITVTRSTVSTSGPTAPGSLVSVSGQVSEPGVDDPVTLQLRWYDGDVQTLTVAQNGTAVRPWGSEKVLTRSSSPGSDPPFPVDLVTVRALAADGSVDPGTTPATVRGIVGDAPPVFSGTTGAPAVAGQPSRLTGDVQDPNGDGVRLVVDWGDGTTPEVLLRPAGSAPLDLRHTYAVSGSYDVVLSARGSLDDPPPSPTAIDPYPTVVSRLQMVVPVAQPALLGAAFRGPQSEGGANPPLDISLGQGPAAHITVDWGDGSTSTQDVDGSGGTISLFQDWPQDGAYDVTVTAVRADGTTRLVLNAQRVANRAPDVGEITTPGLPYRTGPDVEATPVYLELPTDDVAADTLTAVVDWGDGTVGPATLVTPPFQAGLRVEAGHAYATAGFYRVTMTVTDDAGASAVAYGFSHVVEGAPQLGGVVTTPGPEGSLTQLSAAVLDGQGDLGAVSVDWGDGSVESAVYDDDHLLSASHVYADDGTYDVHLVPRGDDGLVGREVVRHVVVAGVAPVLAVTGPAALDEGGTEVVGVAITDPGPDGGTVTLAWGDGSPGTTVPYGPGERSLAVGHTYADDDPTGTVADDLTVRVSAVDSGGLSSAVSTLPVTVRDVAPKLVTAVLTDQLGRLLGPDRPAVAGGETRLRLDGADASPVDVLSGQVRWPGAASDTVADARGQQELSRRLVSASSTSAVLTVRDDDGRSTARALPLTVVTRATALRRAAAALNVVAAEGGVPKASVTRLKDAAKRLSQSAALQPADAAGCVDQALQALEGVGGLTGGKRVALLTDTRLDIALAARAVGQAAVDAAAARAAATGNGLDAVASGRAALLASDATLQSLDSTGAVLGVQQAVRAVQGV